MLAGSECLEEKQKQEMGQVVYVSICNSLGQRGMSEREELGGLSEKVAFE